MSETASLTDIRLIAGIADHHSIAAAASRLHLTQPSASQRLSVLERRLGVILVERDTTGARLTPAGEVFVAHGRRALELVDEAVAQARSPLGVRLRVGTIGSLAPAVFPALQRLLPGHRVDHTTNHGYQLTQAVSDGSLDAVVVGVGPAESPARGVRRTRLGDDPIVLVGRAPTGSGRRPLAGQTVVIATYAHDQQVVAAKAARLGASTLDAASTATALAMARQEGWLAAVPRTTAVSLAQQEHEVESVQLGLAVPIWLVTKSQWADALIDRRAELAEAMGLR